MVDWVEDAPLRLTFLSEGEMWWVVEKRWPPPSCSKNKGGGWQRVRWKRPISLVFRATTGVGSKETEPSVSLETRGRGLVGRRSSILLFSDRAGFEGHSPSLRLAFRAMGGLGP